MHINISNEKIIKAHQYSLMVLFCGRQYHFLNGNLYTPTKY